MPLYEYECDACGHRFEKIQKFSDPLEDTCPKCGGRVHKLASSPAIQFKGTGWYITDYAKKDSAPASKSDSARGEKSDKKEKSESSTDTSSSSSSSESKSETKTETKAESVAPKSDTPKTT
jgi:putative FmdB family regulatory protein